MTVHLLKLCVGCDTIEALADWQARRRAALLREGGGELMHVTRQTPRRTGFGPGSSMYWVMGGFIRCRQVIRAVEDVTGADGIPRCGLVLSGPLIATDAVPRRPFQGWRYIDAADAPPDLREGERAADMVAIPPAMRAALVELRLI